MLVDSDGFELVFGDGPDIGLVAGFDCDADCCGVVSGFYRAFPCRPGVGCGGGPQGSPVWIPTDYVCAPDGSPPGGRSVIGFDRACWIVDTSNVWRLCAPSPNPPPTLFCIPPGSRILPPGTAVACLDDCTAAECLNSLQRWVTLHPCDTVNGWPPGQPLPVVRADGFVGGCIVGRTASGQCFRASCSDVFAARQEDLPPGTVIFADGVDFAFATCCECQCNGGFPASLGCDERFPDKPPKNCCCPPFGILNDGATLYYRVTKVTRGYVFPGYNSVTTETWTGTFTVDSSAPGGMRGAGTYTNRLEYLPGACAGLPTCPTGEPCVREQTSTDTRAPVCPPPIEPSRPCPPQFGGPEGVTWDGVRTCSASYARSVYVNPNPPVCNPFAVGTVSIVHEGLFVLSGVDYRQCSGGCGEEVATPLLHEAARAARESGRRLNIGFEVTERAGSATVTPVVIGGVVDVGGASAPGGGGCAGCSDGGL